MIMKAFVRSRRDVEVYERSFKASMQLFHVSKQFSKGETYSLTDQVRRSSRSACSNTAEAWRKRRYESAFIRKLSDAESEAAETQCWSEFALACEYIATNAARELVAEYEEILSMLVAMPVNSERSVLPTGRKTAR
jgi:four helix bundle protein